MRIDISKLKGYTGRLQPGLEKFLSGKTAEAIVRTFVIVTMIACFVVFVRQDQFSACQGRYDQAYAIYAQTTRKANELTKAQQDELWRTFAEALKRRDQQTLKDIDSAIEKYFKASEESRKQQELSPPPALPEETCGRH